MKNDQVLRQELLALLRGGNAHMSFEDAVEGFPMADINKKLPNASYTTWHLLEHMRIAQWDIVDFVIDPNHQSPEFPGDTGPGLMKRPHRPNGKRPSRDFCPTGRPSKNWSMIPKPIFSVPFPMPRTIRFFGRSS